MSLTVHISLGDCGMGWTAKTEACNRGLHRMSLTVHISLGDCGMGRTAGTEGYYRWDSMGCLLTVRTSLRDWGMGWTVGTEACNRGLHRMPPHCLYIPYGLRDGMDSWDRGLQMVSCHRTHGSPKFPLDSRWQYWTTLDIQDSWGSQDWQYSTSPVIILLYRLLHTSWLMGEAPPTSTSCPPDLIHVIGVPRPSPFSHSSIRFRVLYWTKIEEQKNGGGLGTSLPWVQVTEEAQGNTFNCINHTPTNTHTTCQ